jgi:rubrerythrin
MSDFWKRLKAELSPEPEEEADPDAGKGQYGVDYVAVSELMKFNKNLVEAYKHELAGLEFYRRFLEEANDERGREMYRKLIEEEERHLRMIEEEIEEHRKSGFWS